MIIINMKEACNKEEYLPFIPAFINNEEDDNSVKKTVLLASRFQVILKKAATGRQTRVMTEEAKL